MAKNKYQQAPTQQGYSVAYAVEMAPNVLPDGRLTRRVETASCFSLVPVALGRKIFIPRLNGHFIVSECMPTRRYESTFRDTYLPFEDTV